MRGKNRTYALLLSALLTVSQFSGVSVFAEDDVQNVKTEIIELLPVDTEEVTEEPKEILESENTIEPKEILEPEDTLEPKEILEPENTLDPEITDVTDNIIESVSDVPKQLEAEQEEQKQEIDLSDLSLEEQAKLRESEMSALMLMAENGTQNNARAYSSGEESFTIGSEATLRELAEKINSGATWGGGIKYADSSYIITADIALLGQWIPIGEREEFAFNGVFDGKGHTISGLYHSEEDNTKGLFGFTDTKAVIKNVGVTDAFIVSFGAGILAGNNRGRIESCYSTGKAYSMSGGSGGIAGENYGDIINCYSTADVSDDYAAGGIAGINEGNISNCYSTGSVRENLHYVKYAGGIAGVNQGNGVIANCAALNSDISGNGGNAGSITGGNEGSVTGCYAVSTIKVIGSGGADGTKIIYDSTGGFSTGWDTIFSDTSAWENTARTQIPTLLNAGGNQSSDIPEHLKSTVSVIEIYTIEQLEDFRDEINSSTDYYKDKTVMLMDDLKFNYWEPIGTQSSPFKGTFDGNGHTISGITINAPEESGIGFFGYIASGSTVKDLGVINVNINALSNVGGIAGESNGDVINCYSTGTLIANGYYAGGIVGENYGNIRDSHSTANVNSNYHVGGIAGWNTSGEISNCYSTGNISATKWSGGIVGYKQGGKILNCYNSGDISASDEKCGGIVGCGYQNGEIAGCYNTGTVASKNMAGGIAGTTDCSISDCYSTGGVSATGAGTSAGGIVGAITKAGASVTNCYTLSTVKASSGFAGGIVGSSIGTVSNCAALNPSVSGTTAGGIAGRLTDDKGSANGTVSGCYAISVMKLNGSGDIGGTALTYKGDGFSAGWTDIFSNLTAWENTEKTKLPTLKDVLGNQKSLIPEYMKEQENRIVISTSEELKAFHDDVNGGNTYEGKTVLLAASIALNGKEKWSGIGTEANPFKGIFDGGGMTVSGVNIDEKSSAEAGLFGVTGETATIKNLGLKDAVISAGGGAAGLIVGENKGTVTNCYSTGNITGTGIFGGIAGQNDGTITGCYSTADLQGLNAGGIAGYNYGTVTGCYSTGNVSVAADGKAGGIAAEIGSSGSITNCYSISAVSADGTNSKAGGIVGNVSEGSVRNCVALNVSVSGAGNVGRIAGNGVYGLSVADCFASVAIDINSNQGVDGTDITYDSTAGLNKGWDEMFTSLELWEITGGNKQRPILKNAGGIQNSNLPDNVVMGAQIIIYNYEELKAFRDDVNGGNTYEGKTVLLAAPIELNFRDDWTPIGNTDHPFKGTFDGNGFEIEGSITLKEGLFGFVDRGAAIKNLGVHINNGTQEKAAGAIAINNSGTILNCYSTGMLKIYISNLDEKPELTIGGIASYNKGTIKGCYSSAYVTTQSNESTVTRAGGIAGLNDGIITDCYSDDNRIESLKDCVGGIAGENRGSIINCYSTSEVLAKNDFAGGIAGKLSGGSIENCVALNLSVSGKGYVGRIAGGNLNASTVKNCFASVAIDIKSIDGVDGTDMTYDSGTGFDIGWESIFVSPELWENMGRKQRPTLKNAGGTQSSELSEKITTGTHKIISSSYDLEEFRDAVNSGNSYEGNTVTLSGDINIDSRSWEPIGTVEHPFNGTFDGCGYEITGIRFNETSGYVGLFGYVGEKAVIKRLGVTCNRLEGENTGSIGIIAGYNKGLLDSCLTIGDIKGKFTVAGGIVGENEGQISNCFSISGIEMESSGNYGGIAGINGGGISNCFSMGDMKAESGTAGGITGKNTGAVSNCAALNPSVIALRGGRITSDVEGTLTNNFSNKTMLNNFTVTETDNANGYNGKAAPIGDIANDSTLFADSYWNLKEGYYPALKALPKRVYEIDTFVEEVPVKVDIVTLLDGAKTSDIIGEFVLKNGNDVITDLDKVPMGTYKVYDGSKYSGVDVVVKGIDTSVEINYYSVQFYDGDTAYGDSTAQKPQVVLSGQNAEKPMNPQKNGVSFERWNTSKDGTAAFDFLSGITAPTKVYASWITPSIAIDPLNIAVGIGMTQKFNATVSGWDGVSQDVTWSVSGSSSAGTAIDANGLLKIAEDETAKALTITAAAAVNQQCKATATVTVTEESIELSQQTVDFASIKQGDKNPDAKNITITNKGTAVVEIAAISSEHFAAAIKGSTSLSHGETTELSISPKDSLPVGNYAENITVKYNKNIAAVQVKFIVNPTGGGSSGGGGGGGSSYTQSNVTVDDDRIIIKTDGKVSQTDADKAVEYAKIKGSAQIKVSTSENECVLPNGMAEKVGKETKADLVVAMPNGTVIIPNSILRVLDPDGKLAVSIDDGKISISAGGKELADIGGIEITLPYKENKDTGNVAVEIINTDEVRYVIENVYKNGYVNFEIEGTVQYTILDNYVPLASIPEEPVNPFKDIDTHWAEDAILKATQMGLFSGVTEDTFEPDTALTRGMAVEILYRMSGEETKAEESFDDVEPGAYYADAVRWALETNIVNGFEDGRFRPDDPVTREQLAVMLYNYANHMGMNTNEVKELSVYTDSSDISGYAVRAVQWACGSGIMSGRDDGTFDAKSFITRAEAASMLVRFLEK